MLESLQNEVNRSVRLNIEARKYETLTIKVKGERKATKAYILSRTETSITYTRLIPNNYTKVYINNLNDITVL